MSWDGGIIFSPHPLRLTPYSSRYLNMCAIAGILKLNAPATPEDVAAVQRPPQAEMDRQSRYGLSLTGNKRDWNKACFFKVGIEGGDFSDAVFLHERNRGAIREAP